LGLHPPLGENEIEENVGGEQSVGYLAVSRNSISLSATLLASSAFMAVTVYFATKKTVFSHTASINHCETKAQGQVNAHARWWIVLLWNEKLQNCIGTSKKK
jgi:hypothetical protein